jgi:hypothetical protein
MFVFLELRSFLIAWVGDWKGGHSLVTRLPARQVSNDSFY